MDIKLKKLLDSLFDDEIPNKEEIIMNIGLILEMNTDYYNPTDYSLILSQDLCKIKLSMEDKEKVVYSLVKLLKMKPIFAKEIIWSIGKTYDEECIEKLINTIIELQLRNKEVLEQLSFVVEVVNNDKIIHLYEMAARGKVQR